MCHAKIARDPAAPPPAPPLLRHPPEQTTTVLAVVWFLVPVDTHVRQQVRVTRERRPANLARERFLPRVRAHVLHQLNAVEEVLVALCALVLLWNKVRLGLVRMWVRVVQPM